MMLYKKKSFLLIIIAYLVLPSLVAQKKSSSHDISSFSYILPYNYFDIEVTLVRQEQKKGPLVDFANKLTENKQEIIQKDSFFYTFSTLRLTWKSDGDTTKIFPIQVNQPSFETFAKNGMIVGFCPIQTIQETYNFELAETKPFNNRFYLFHPNEKEQIFDTTYQIVYKDEEIIRIPKVSSRLQPQSGESYAQEVIDEILDIRDTRKDLLSGMLEVDFSRLDLMLEGLNAREADLAVLFTGYTEKTSETQTFRVIPEGNADTLYCPLFGFSSSFGFTKDNYIQRYKLMLCKEKPFHIPLSATTPKNNGVIVNNPAYYAVFLMCDNELLQCLGHYPIAQSGTTKYVDESLLQIEINPYTGAVETIKPNKK